MHIIFAQPRSLYPVNRDLTTITLTFPQLIADIGLHRDYSFFFEDLEADVNFRSLLIDNKATHVFLSAITSTFPNAIRLANIAHESGVITVLGGIFATICSEKIASNFPCFDFVVEGCPDHTLLGAIGKKNIKPFILKYPRTYCFKPLSQVLSETKLLKRFHNINICYELSNGCNNNCTFCTLYHSRLSKDVRLRELPQARSDIEYLSGYTSHLKLIDDDVLNFSTSLKELRINDLFHTVIAETRLDRLTSEKNIELLKKGGITHIIFGVETLNESAIAMLRPNLHSKAINRKTNFLRAIELLKAWEIVARPVIMLDAPNTNENDIQLIEESICGMSQENGVEILFAFFTPHPGTYKTLKISHFITTDLSLFDHLHPVYNSNLHIAKDNYILLESYERMVNLTNSRLFNPQISLTTTKVKKYNVFFE